TVSTDVYGLGALLYELLTGRRVFSTTSVPRTALELRILDQSPERLSIAAREKGQRWSKRLRGDLDTIVAKALAKEPDQRYSSAADLSADIERFLARQPVLARKPSLRYRLGMLIRRNRLASAITVPSLILVLALGAAVWRQAGRTARERDLARAEQQRADRVVALLVDLFSTANPEMVPGGTDLSIGEFLDRAERSVLDQRDADPRVQARLRHTLGKVFLARSQYPRARSHLEAALALFRQTDGKDDPSTAAVFHDLARLTAEVSPTSEAVPLLRQSLQLHRNIYG